MIRYNRAERKLTGAVSRQGDRFTVDYTPTADNTTLADVEHLQSVVYVMCGGGFLGRFAAEQPADFYIDMRVGRLPYSRKDILQAVEVLHAEAVAIGLDPHNMPKAPRFHSCWVF